MENICEKHMENCLYGKHMCMNQPKNLLNLCYSLFMLLHNLTFSKQYIDYSRKTNFKSGKEILSIFW